MKFAGAWLLPVGDFPLLSLKLTITHAEPRHSSQQTTRCIPPSYIRGHLLSKYDSIILGSMGDPGCVILLPHGTAA